MTYVNVHDSFNDNSRHSDGCPTVPHDDPEGFFDNFDWSGTYNGHSGTTGTSTGTIIVQRGASAEDTKDQLERQLQEQIFPIPDGMAGFAPVGWVQ